MLMYTIKNIKFEVNKVSFSVINDSGLVFLNNTNENCAALKFFVNQTKVNFSLRCHCRRQIWTIGQQKTTATNHGNLYKNRKLFGILSTTAKRRARVCPPDFLFCSVSISSRQPTASRCQRILLDKIEVRRNVCKNAWTICHSTASARGNNTN